MYWRYFKYTCKHKWYVFKECRKVGCTWLGIIHDLSKFRLSEFIPYARYFYGRYPEESVYEGTTTKHPRLFKEDVDMRFAKAWLLHIHRNPHHWQYWILQEEDGSQKLIPIPVKYLKEMVCDWKGAGWAKKGRDDLHEWYDNNRHKMKLNRTNRLWVEKHIG